MPYSKDHMHRDVLQITLYRMHWVQRAFHVFFVETASEVAFLEASTIFIQACTESITAPIKPTKRTFFRRRVSEFLPGDAAC